MASNPIGLVIVGLILVAASVAIGEAGRQMVSEGVQTALANRRRY